MRKIAHIINPVKAGESSDLFVAQPITFETMRIAKEFAKGKVDVSLFTAQFPEDRAIIPEWFTATPDLDRSILDMGKFQEKRKLPLIKDILDRLYENTDAEYFIYSNVDIAVMPSFYLSVNKIIEDGYDAFVINRRTISEKYRDIEQIPLMFSEPGEAHQGHDCFIFRTKVYPRYELGSVCIGINWVGRILICNLAFHAEKFEEFKDRHLTFHIGDDKTWKSKQYSEYAEHNKNETINALSELKTKYGDLNSNVALDPYLKDIVITQNNNTTKGLKKSFLNKFIDTVK